MLNFFSVISGVVVGFCARPGGYCFHPRLLVGCRITAGGVGGPWYPGTSFRYEVRLHDQCHVKNPQI